jgi:general secretion pathway protein D
VTPTINEGDTVLLKLQVESSSLAASSAGAVDLITNKNSITTSVLVRDGSTLVLGGLIQDSVTNSESQVPILGSIPIIGELFRTRNTEKTKTNFLIFLQPHILRDDEQAAEETDAKYNYIKEQQAILNRDKKIIPFQPFAPADPLPSITRGRTNSGILSPDANATTNGTPAGPAPAASPPPGTTPFDPVPAQPPVVTSPDNSQSAGAAK